MKINIFSILIFLILCGKFYYLLGFIGHLKPTADIKIIIIKDILIISLIVLTTKYFLENINNFKYFIFTIILIISISIMHYIGGKNIEIITQHYLRNVALIIMMYPTAIYLIRDKNVNLERLIFYFSILNMTVGWAQVIFIRDSLFNGRVLGLCGDPIVYSIILGISLPLLSKYIKNRKLYLICVALFGYQIDASGSVIPFVALIISASIAFFRECIRKKYYQSFGTSIFFTIGIITDLLTNNSSATRKFLNFLFELKIRQTQSVSKIPDTLQGRIDGLDKLTKFEWEKFSNFIFGCTSCKDYQVIDIFYISALNNFGLIAVILMTIPFFYLLLCSIKNNSNYYIYLSIFIILLSLGNPIHYKFPLNLVIILFVATFFNKTNG